MSEYADTLLFNGLIYTADAADNVFEALAVKGGRIMAAGASGNLSDLVGPSTRKIDLGGKVAMPGLIDAHLHPVWGGKMLASHSLEYETLTVEQALERLQAFIDSDGPCADTHWLRVQAWARSAMSLAGGDITRVELDRLSTNRPVFLFSTDCHCMALNSRGLELLGLDAQTPDPEDGKYRRNADGSLTGIIDDAPAMRFFDRITALERPGFARLADSIQKALNSQGVTTCMDARVYPEHFDAFLDLAAEGRLTLRYFGVREITPNEAGSPEETAKTVAVIARLAERYNSALWVPSPSVGLCGVKLFMDGVVQKPLMTGRLLSPYLENQGTDTLPDWQPSANLGDLYFSQEQVDAVFEECAKHGLNPHMHAVGEGSIEVALRGIAKMRRAYPGKDIRPVIAHNELVAGHQYALYRELDVTALVAYQWGTVPENELVDLCNMFGAERFRNFEPHGRFIDNGCRLIYGSDWPIDPLGYWYNFKVGLTRTGEDGPPRLDTDRDLTVREALRGATINAAYSLGGEKSIGSLEPGKLADLIVLDRNVLTATPEDIENTRVLMTMVGGEVVFEA